MALFSRRTASAAFLALALAACGNGDGAGKSATPTSGVDSSTTGHVKGSADAPITLIEYASPTCPACKYFHDTVEPELFEKYVATGKVKFVYREYPLNDIDVAAYAMARCAGEDKFFDVLDDLFENQNGVRDAAQNGVVKATFVAIGARHGIESEEALDACLADKTILNALADTYQTAEEYGVTGTPTFVINGKVQKFEGEFRDAEGFGKYFDSLLAETAAE